MAKRRGNIEAICSACEQTYWTYPCELKRAKHGNFCSRDCHVKNLKLQEVPEPKNKMLERFWSKVTKTESCWIYGNGSNKHQVFYRRQIDGGFISAHVFSFLLVKELSPDHEVIRHSCDVPACVNPDHLISGTQLENVRDMHERGRWRSPGRISAETVKMIRCLANAGFSKTSISRQFQISRVNVHHIIKRITYKYVE